MKVLKNSTNYIKLSHKDNVCVSIKAHFVLKMLTESLCLDSYSTFSLKYQSNFLIFLFLLHQIKMLKIN